LQEICFDGIEVCYRENQVQNSGKIQLKNGNINEKEKYLLYDLWFLKYILQLELI